MDNASNEESDTHIFTQPGQYTVMLTVTDDFGQTGQATVVINALAANVPPTVQLTASPSSGSAPLIVNFMANATDDDGDTLSYLWDFGDGSSSTDANPVHEFTQEGNYEVTVTVSDNNFEVQNTIQITVAPSFEFKTKRARLEINHEKEFRDKIHIKARFDSSAINLSSDDVIRISINQTVLLEQPLSSFVQKDDEGMLKYKDKHLYAKLNPAKGFIKLSRHEMNLADIDASELVNIELALGSQVSNEAIQFIHVGHEKCQKNSHDKHYHEKQEKHQRKESVNKDIYIYRAHREKHSQGDHGKHGAHKHEKSGDEETPN